MTSQYKLLITTAKLERIKTMKELMRLIDSIYPDCTVKEFEIALRTLNIE